LDRQIANLADSEVRIEAQHQAIAGGQLPSEMTPQEKLTLCRASMQERLAALARQDRLLRDLAADNEVKSKELQEYLTQNQLLNSELDSVQKLLDGFNDTLNRIQILPQGSRRTLETLTPAAMGEFYGPALVPYLFGGTTLGFLLLAGCALLVDWLDQSFRNPDEISSTLGLSIVGHIPQMDLKNKASHLPPLDPSLCTVAGTCENASEAIRSVRTGLFFSESGSGHRIIQVTSPVPGDGKSTVSANLAAAIAQSGRTVLLIDADLRRPRVAKLFGFNQKQGLADILQGRKGLEDLVNSCPIPNLTVLAGLSEVSNPTELLSHHRFVELLDTVRKNYDYVIVDSPPVLAAADACAVAARVDGVLLTIRLRRDSKPVAIRASKILETVGARVLGIVVNGVTGRGYEYRYDNYGYYGVHKPRSEASYPNLAGPNLIAEQESPALTKRY
jgi:succinoglycan biosynthesis transport protein ExoP